MCSAASRTWRAKSRLHRPAGRGLRDLGFPDYEVALATRPAVRAGDDATWDWSEAKLGDAARQCGLAPQINPGEGAFYGPKLEFALRDRLGRSWQCGTVQLDGVLPQRLEASYVAPDGSRARPLMIHHAIFGSLGRMIAILLEHHGGVLPFWLSPDQVAVAPISKDQAGYGADVLAAFWDAGIRAVAYDGADTLSRRIVAAQEMAVPVMAIVGGREMRDGRVNLRDATAHRPTFRWPRRYPTCRQGCGRALPWPKRCKTCCWRARRSVAPRVGCFTRYEAKNLVQPGTADMSKGWLRRTKCGPDSQPQNDSYCCQSNRKSAHAEPQN
jgi:Threonyl-tRNA synthetase